MNIATETEGAGDPMLLDWDKVIALNANTKVHFIEGARHFPMCTHPDSFTNTFNTILRDSF
jgi:hypothetical protein